MARDREVVDAALAIIGTRDSASARVLHIRNTLHLEDIEVSEPCLDEPARETDFAVEQPVGDFCFDSSGNMVRIAQA